MVRTKLLPAVAAATLHVLETQLAKYIDSGEFADPSIALLRQTQSAPSHNCGNERLQGMTDYQKRRAPIASARFVAAKVSHKSNKTGHWIDTQTAARQRHIILKARLYTRKVQAQKVARENTVKLERFSRRRMKSQKKENTLKNKRSRAVDALCYPGAAVPAETDVRSVLGQDIPQVNFFVCV